MDIAATPAATGTATAMAPDPGLRLREAARRFEALLISELLRAMPGAEEGDAVAGMAQTQLAEALSASGGLGLAPMVVRALEGSAAPAQALQLCETKVPAGSEKAP